MTEEEWLECEEPTLMLNFLGRKKKLITERKLRLFAVACARRIWDTIAWEPGRKAIEMAERFADGEASKKELRAAHVEAIRGTKAFAFRVTAAEWRVQEALVSAINASGNRASVPHAASCAVDAVKFKEPERLVQCDLVRDVAGNPFRPAALDPTWRTDTVLSLAKQMYESRDFSAMPILADALQDVGCENADILDHCRGPGPHVRGCWVVDLILGKE